MNEELLSAFRRRRAEVRELRVTNLRCKDQALILDTQHRAKLRHNEELAQQLKYATGEYLHAKHNCDAIDRSLKKVWAANEIIEQRLRNKFKEMDGLNIQLKITTNDLSLVTRNLHTSEKALMNVQDRIRAIEDAKKKQIADDQNIQELQEKERKLIEEFHALRGECELLNKILNPDYSIFKIIGKECLAWVFYFSIPGFPEPKIERLHHDLLNKLYVMIYKIYL